MRYQNRIAAAAAALALLATALTAHAKLNDAEIARLGADLTPVGAEKAGNKDGTIPAWDGGLCAPPAGWTQGKAVFKDPYAADKPLFTITKANAAQYKDKLPAGAFAILNKYPNFAMAVYPTHRSACYPKEVYETVKAEAGTAELEGWGLRGRKRTTVPFPIPKNGLEGIWNHELRWRTVTGVPVRRAARRLAVPAALGITIVGLALGFAAGVRVGRGGQQAEESIAEPSFMRLTFSQGMVRAARFAPDGKTVIYGAAWEGQPLRLYMTRVEAPESTPLALPAAEILAVSSPGELAVSLDPDFVGWMGAGTLARAPLRGGAARPVLENVREADWTPDGSDLAIVRRVGSLEQIEFPPGNVLVSTSGYLSHLRFSPQGDRIAFVREELFVGDLVD